MNPDRRTLLGGAMLAGAVAGLSSSATAQTPPASTEMEVLPLWPKAPPGGEALYRALQGRGDGSDARLIFVSGDTVSEDAARLLESASVPVILKPFDLEDVVRRVESVGNGGPAA